MVGGFVDQSGGFVELDSEPGQGTSIRLFLPANEAVAQTGKATPAQHNGKNKRILVVEDEALVRETVTRYLREKGYQTVEADSGDGAMALLDQDGRVDLVLSDVVMPGRVDGVQLAAEVVRRWPGMPVILSTGYADRVPGISGGLGKFTVMRKPYNMSLLAKTIAEKLSSPN